LNKVLADLTNLFKNLDKTDKDDEFVSMLEQILGKIKITLNGGRKLARIMRPLDKDPIKFHKELMELPGI